MLEDGTRLDPENRVGAAGGPTTNRLQLYKKIVTVYINLTRLAKISVTDRQIVFPAEPPTTTIKD